MKITLKKASALVLALSAIIDKTVIPSVLEISPFSDAPDQNGIDEAYGTMHSSVLSVINTIEAKFALRMLVSQANEGSVNTLLCWRADVEGRLKMLQNVPSRVKSSEISAVAREIVAKREGGTALSHLRSPTVVFELETASFLSPFIKVLTKKKREIDDELQKLNFSTEITLPEEVIKVLTDCDLI